MNDKQKKIVTIVFTAVVSLIVSLTALFLDIPASDLLPDMPDTSASVIADEPTTSDPALFDGAAGDHGKLSP